MSCAERFVVFDCVGDSCVGVLSEPGAGTKLHDVAVLIVVGGPQYRVGSHRQFTLLARALAGAGYPVLRFDYRGMGDSAGDARSFESIDDDLAAAIEAVQRETGARRVVIWGLCDGASGALMYAPGDQRVAGIVALNPWAHSAQLQASVRLKHYYVQRLFSRDLWRKVFAGNFDVRRSADGLSDAIRDAGDRSVDSRPFLERMQDGWQRFRGPVLFLLSGSDFTAREFEQWVAADGSRRKLLADALAKVERFPEADHTFSKREWRDAVANKTIEWLAHLHARS